MATNTVVPDPAPDRNFAWVAVQAEGGDVLSAASQVWKQYPDRPFNIDALKKAVKVEFAPDLDHASVAKIKVYAGDEELPRLSALVEDQAAGQDEDHPLVVKYPPPPPGAVGSVGAPATHPGSEAGVGEKRTLDNVIQTELTSLRETFDQRMESLEKAVKEQREESVRMSDISACHIKAANRWYGLEEADVQIQNVVPDIDPFVWDDRDEPLHEEEYLQYLQRFCRPGDLSWQSLRKISTYLKVDLGPYNLSGTADVALVYASAVLNHRFHTDHKATLLVGEMKKKVDPADVCQSKAELLAHAKLQGSKGHALSMLSDLQDDWYFFWIHAAEKKFYSLRCERGAARHLLNCLFCNGPIDDVPQPILARSALEDLGPRREHPEGGDADEDEQDLENFDVDGSLSAKDILQVKMQKVVHQLAAANPVWGCMFS
mmetsp:Transcript_57972/g.136396  ORF Transcript_57972/g.136396 Transcript_57972/m.136396 type:complete len:431 (-) Transcript_57972:167-1459(-)